MANINKIRLSGQTYNIEDVNATKTVELTQAQYDALTVKDPNTFYVITDAQGVDLSNYYTKSETDDLLDTKLDVSAYTPTDLSNYYTKSETSGATEISTALNAKQETLVAGSGITISGNVISAEAQPITVDTALDSGSTNPVENRVIYNKIDEVEEVTAAALNHLNDRVSEDEEVTAAALNHLNDRVSEDEEVTAAGLNALNDALGGLKLVKLTQTQYDNLQTKDSNTLYVII